MENVVSKCKVLFTVCMRSRSMAQSESCTGAALRFHWLRGLPLMCVRALWQ